MQVDDDGLPHLTFRESTRGGGDGRALRGSVVELLRRIPYLLAPGLVPPLSLVNEVLRKGRVEAGMSGGLSWTPLELSAAQHRVLVDALDADSTGGASRPAVEPPDWIETRTDWSAWMAHRRYGIPLEESRELNLRMQRLQQLVEAAGERGDGEARMAHLCELSEVARAWAELVDRHRRGLQRDSAD